jgi:bacillolysin
MVKLSYKVKANLENTSLSGNYFIDANTNIVLYFEPSICTAHDSKVPPNAPGTAQTLYSGNRNFTTDANFNGGFRLREIRNGVNLWTLNANNESNVEVIANNATDFFDNDNNWQAIEHGVNRYATDVHWATENVLDYWSILHSRNSINGLGMNAVGYVHTSMPWAQNVNAFWDRDRNAMFYADGNAALGFGPIAAFDVVAHEFGHGVCQYTSGLIAGAAESGALNEGFSDIWGAAIEAFAAPTKNRWLIGEDIFPTNLRNLQNPKDPTSSERRNGTGSHPDTYLQQFWQADGEPHFNSTILSHWFFLISDGGSGTNDLGNNFNVNPLGIIIAGRIAYATERFLPSTAGYLQARATSIQFARDTYGIGSCEEISVTNAWFAVGVGAAYQINATITGATPICSTGATYTVSNIPCNGLVTWTVSASSGSSITLTNYTGITTSIIIPSNFPQSASIILTATITGIANPITKTIFYGQPGFGASYKNGVSDGNPVAIYFPSQGNNNIFNNVCIGYGFPNVYIDAQPYGTNNVSWSVPNGYATSAFSLQQQNGNRAYFGWNYGGTTPPGYLQASVSNGCGSFSQIFAFKQVNCGTPGGDPCTSAKGVNYFTISPNPASDNIKIGIGNKPAPIECKNLNALNGPNGIIFSAINVYDNLGTLVKSHKTKDAKTATIQIGNLIAGSYLVEIIQGDYIEKQHIIVQK